MPAQPQRASQTVRKRSGTRRPAGRDRGLDVLAMIALGGGIGSTARYLISQIVPVPPDHFPWATFLINVTGCLLLGLLMALVVEIWPPRRYVRPFVGVGILGGYTTFSTFAVEIRGLAAHRLWALAGAYSLGSLVGGLTAVFCGIALGRLLGRRPVRRRVAAESVVPAASSTRAS